MIQLQVRMMVRSVLEILEWDLGRVKRRLGGYNSVESGVFRITISWGMFFFFLFFLVECDSNTGRSGDS